MHPSNTALKHDICSLESPQYCLNIKTLVEFFPVNNMGQVLLYLPSITLKSFYLLSRYPTLAVLD